MSALNESDIGNLMIYIAHYYQGFVGESVDYTDEYPEEPICNYVKLSDIYNAAYKYFGIDIDDIYTRLSPEDFKNAPKIFWNCGNPVVKVKGEPCINVGVQIDANFVCVPVIDKIYSLGDDSYYVLYKYWRDTDTMYKPDDEYSEYIPDDWDFSPIKEGYAVIKSRVEKGEKHYYIVNCGANAQSFLSPSELNRYLTISRRPSNIKIDYKKIKSYTKPEQYIEYLEKQLGNTKPNDSAKSEIIKFIEHAVENVANTEIKVKGKKITITAEDIKDAVKKAKELRRAFDKLLSEKDITLNKAVDTVIRIDTKGVALNKGVTVVYDSSLSESFDEISGIKVIYDADRQSVSCDAKSIKKYFDNGEGQVKIIVKDNEYKIEFLDKHGKTVKKAAAQLKFAFRINSKYDTVYYHNGKKKTNWSGQINDADNTIEFQTATSGIYTVEKNEPKISDIDDLTEQQQEAVKFMVSRGYFELENDRFNPYRSLSRYEFTQTLVSIFYALDFDAKTSFSDVKKSSVYYEYVASSEQENIVKGFEDGTFKGNKNTTKEEVISIASRTLAEKKGYIYPENTDEYVQFADNEEIEGWENQYGEIALAVREGLIDKGGILAPKSNITRVEAAVILYRLFNCLYEITPIQTNTKSSSAGFPAGAAAAAGGVAVIGGASAAFVIIRKRKLHI